MALKSIVAKLWLSIILLLVVIIAILGIGLFELEENFYYSQVTKNLTYQGEQIADLYSRDPGILKNDEEINRFSQIVNSHIIVLNEKGIVQVCNATTHIQPGEVFQESELSKIFKGEEISKIGYYEHFDTQMLAIGIPVIRNNQVMEALFIYAPVAPISETLNSLRNLVFWALLGAIILSSLLAFFLSRSLPKPLLRMNEIALNLARGDYSQRVTVKSGDEIGVLGASLNYLSEQLKKNISELSNEKEKVENILIGMSDGVISIDTRGKILLINPQARYLLGCDEEVKENSLLENCPSLLHLNSLYLKVIETTESTKGEISYGDKTLAVRLSPLFDMTGDLTGVIVVLQDMTREFKLEQMRRDFVANVSHELRTPISLIQGYAEALEDHLDDSPDKQTQFIHTIMDESNRLKRLVEDLLELSRLQSGRINLDAEQINLTQVAEQIQTKYNQTFIQHQIEFITKINPDAGTVWADRFRFEQILINLIDNGVRYASGGTLTLTSEKARNGIQICLSDTGKGIPEEDLPYIFERFYRADKSRNRETGGTGLGLSIVKNLVEAHGGGIAVESRLGQGTKFRLYFPDSLKEQNQM
ncbi:MAG: cell wall metabolism sensor histidine kinase WalK [Peptococcaceae bacterium]|nr:cell wall metabolism sensor histidine kinase WalK [Peptococcaceae bacterium]